MKLYFYKTKLSYYKISIGFILERIYSPADIPCKKKRCYNILLDISIFKYAYRLGVLF